MRIRQECADMIRETIAAALSGPGTVEDIVAASVEQQSTYRNELRHLPGYMSSEETPGTSAPRAGKEWSMGIDNTTKRFQDPAEQMALLGEAMITRSADSFIERQERDGQRQLVNSDRLPADCGDRAPWLALGFTLGEPDSSDPLFMPATLPPGWQRQATGHSMGSVIVDTLGRERVSIFYKAAFYDRSAHMSLVGLGWYVTKAVEYDGPAIIFDDEWATREAVAAAMREIRDSKLAEAADFRGYAADTERRDEKNRADCARIADEREAVAAKYEAAIAELSTDG